MNIFIIPSWYPSPNQPLTGLFFKEQAENYTQLHDDTKIGISIWGQNDEQLLLWSKDLMESLLKLTKKNRESYQRVIGNNVIELFTPAFTWSRHILNGNIKGILAANKKNYNAFKTFNGPPDIILAHVGYPGGYLAYRMSLIMNIPYVIMENMSPLPFKDYCDSKGQWMSKLKKAYTHAYKIVAVSKSISEVFHVNGFKNTSIIPNYIDDNLFTPHSTRQVHSMPKALTIGRIEYQKGIDVLLYALTKLKKPLTIDIGGDGTALKKYQHLSNELSVNQKVKWLGAFDRNEVLKAMQHCDFFVLASRHESFGIVVLEALACGKPCIVTKCGGPEEIINEEVGIVVEKENPEALAAAMDYMSQNLEKYPPEKIRQYYETHFSARKITQKLRNVLEDAVRHSKNTPIKGALK